MDTTIGKNIKSFLDSLLRIISVCFFSGRNGFDCWLNFGRNRVNCNHRGNYSGSDQTRWISLSSASAASDRRWHRQHHLDVTSNLIGWLSVTQTTFSRCLHWSDWMIGSDMTTPFGCLHKSDWMIFNQLISHSTRHFLLFNQWHGMRFLGSECDTIIMVVLK